MELLFIFLSVIIAAIVAMGFYLSGPHFSGSSPNFRGSRFQNMSGTRAKGLYEVLKWALNRKPGHWTMRSPTAFEKPPAHVKEGIRITFINHSTFLIQADGINILTDPVWSKRASPFSFIGPRRMVPPGLPITDLPPIDIVLLTHNHYDHLDLATLKSLSSPHPRYFVPLGVDKFLSSHGITDSVAMDWWSPALPTDSLRIEAVPAQHFSGRGMFDRDKTLWCGFVVHFSSGKLYFMGDTGFDEGTFNEIARRTGPYKVALITIGAYKPKWFMSPIHISPDQAARLHVMLNPELSIGMHFGTFPLADDGQDDPIEDLKASKEALNIPENAFITLAHGDCIHIP